ncbi:MAG: argininosuccinate lyase [Eubacteriales bacterium]|jgi:argininosuccinate lyase|nr:argininosuccinate lyase [Oscillospiraceae bacterium]MBQ2071900.1 argininosuccinate lyase [Oscillospiraceae bacterium]MBQ5427868.1 argininosuccinate lyase [Oscillospiraceae bacterium]
MAKMWTGVTAGKTDPLADDFNSSIRFDKRMARQDITGSIAHAAMLASKGIITEAEGDALAAGLAEILEDLQTGKLTIDESCEDIHMFVEQVLTERIGETGKKLHTARSRNDQVALDLRMTLRDENDEISGLIRKLLKVLADTAEKHKESIMPGYTHLQRAQPVSFGHHLMAYAMMLLRDLERLKDCRKRTNVSPIGCCALAGTTYETDRQMEAGLLGFEGIAMNSMDGVSDRDFAVEMLSTLAILMMHLSRLSEELILWASWEFRFISLSDAYTTGSSIMPQKRNADMAELIRGKTGRVYGELMGLLTTLKGLPLAYNKDMQEDKEGVFDACDTVKMCLKVLTPMLESMQVNTGNMLLAAQKGFINATDLADYLVKKGMPFRTAYKISGQIVRHCMETGQVLETLPPESYREFSELFDDDVYAAIDLKACMEKRISEGGTSASSVEKQIALVRKEIGE